MDRQFIGFSSRLESWFETARGQYLLETEKTLLDRELETGFGYNLLHIGPMQLQQLCSGSPIEHQIFMSSEAGSDSSVGSDVYAATVELPFETGSIDVAVLHHVLEWSEHPHQILRELQRVVAPQGHLIVVSFNPRSLHGVAAFISRVLPNSLWHQRAISSTRLTDWFNLLGFSLQSVQHGYAIPPPDCAWLNGKVKRLDHLVSRKKLPLGGVQVYHAISEISRLTPIRPRWRPMSTSLIGLGVQRPVAPSSRTGKAA